MLPNQEIDLMLIKSCKSSFGVSHDLFSLGFSGLTSAQHKHANKPLSDEEEEEVDFFPSMTWKVAFSYFGKEGKDGADLYWGGLQPWRCQLSCAWPCRSEFGSCSQNHGSTFFFFFLEETGSEKRHKTSKNTCWMPGKKVLCKYKSHFT